MYIHIFVECMKIFLFPFICTNCYVSNRLNIFYLGIGPFVSKIHIYEHYVYRVFRTKIILISEGITVTPQNYLENSSF